MAHTRKHFVLVPLLFGLAMLLPQAAAAFRWFARGEVLYPAGPLAPEISGMSPILGGAEAAWKCQHLVLLEAAIWSWDCQPVASHPTESAWAPLPPELVDAVVERHPLASVQRSVWNRYGMLLLLLGPLPLLAWRAWHPRR